MESPKRKEEWMKRDIAWKVMTKDFPYLIKDINPQLSEAWEFQTNNFFLKPRKREMKKDNFELENK